MALGLVDETADEAAVMPVSVGIARQLAALPGESLRHTRGQIRGPVLERIFRQRGTDDTVHRIWGSRAARRRSGPMPNVCCGAAWAISVLSR